MVSDIMRRVYVLHLCPIVSFDFSLMPCFVYFYATKAECQGASPGVLCIEALDMLPLNGSSCSFRASSYSSTEKSNSLELLR